MRAVQFLLECALVAVVVGAFASLAVAAFQRLTRRWTEELAPSVRADIYLVEAMLPAGAAVFVVLAAAGPSVLALFGLHDDHCGTHLHHAHLCLLHAFDVPASRTLLGACALGILAFQGVHLLAGAASRHRAIRAIEALGTIAEHGRFALVHVPGEPRLCHAVGLSRRRVLLSRSLACAVTDTQLGAALAHEEAHHDRWDGLAGFLVRATAIFHPPRLMKSVIAAHRVATEEAADACAARAVGSARLVAEAIVSIARVQVGMPSLDNGITSADIERRVLRLLAGAPDRSSPGLRGVACLYLSLFTLVMLGADPVHHAVETLLHLM